MDIALIDPFIQAVREVVGQFGLPAEPAGGIALHDDTVTTEDVTTFIGLVGNMTGIAACSFEAATARSLASVMMMGMPVESLDAMAQSALAELTNMICGTAVIALSSVHSGIDITPPSVVVGENMLFIMGSSASASVPIDLGIGMLHLTVSLES